MRQFLKIRWAVANISVRGVAACLFIAVWLMGLAIFVALMAPVMLVLLFCPKLWCLRFKDFVLSTVARTASVVVWQTEPGSVELNDGRVSINVAGRRWGE